MTRVMIVDDEPSALERYSDYVNGSGLGFTVVATCSAAQPAVEKLRTVNPDVVLTDIRMPGKNGLQMIEEMRSGGWDGYAVVISGHDDFEFVREAMRLQMVDYLLKPIFPDDMTELLERLRQKASRSPAPGTELLPGVDWEHLPSFIRKAVDYARNNYERHLSLTEAADHGCVNPTYLSTVFSQHCGVSFVEFCHRVRVAAAQELLRNTDLTLADVAERVGCTDASHLNRLFRKVTGKTPGRFRAH
ncbi:MAG: response regulator transcription factor [Spirochaetota bacterium]